MSSNPGLAMPSKRQLLTYELPLFNDYISIEYVDSSENRSALIKAAVDNIDNIRSSTT